MSERDEYPPEEPEGTQPRVHPPGPPQQRIVGTTMGAETGADKGRGNTDAGENERQPDTG